MAELTIQEVVEESPAAVGTSMRPDPATRPPQAPATASSAAVSVPHSGRYPFEFTGTGSEYFRIWVVNVLLTLATFGVYSAWAKVRRLQYFYRNTRVAGAIFDYHGDPKAILKGRVLALMLFAAYNIAAKVSAVALGIVVLMLVAVMPWLLARAFRFKLVNSTYRHVRFHFRGTVGQAYRMLSLFPLLLLMLAFLAWSVVTSFGQRPGIGVVLVVALLPITLALMVPLAHYKLKHYQHDNAYFGAMPFFFHPKVADFFKIYGKSIVINVIGGLAMSLLFAAVMMGAGVFKGGKPSEAMFMVIGVLSLVFFYGLYLIVRAYLDSRLQNLVWNQTELGFVRFESTMTMRKLAAIRASNMLLLVLTLGLYKPFAAVRLARYRAQCMALVSVSDPEEFLADHAAEDAGAAGQEVGDLFNIDIGF